MRGNVVHAGDVGIQTDGSFGHLVRDEQPISVEHAGLAVGLIDGTLRRSARIRRPGPQIRTPFAGANPNKKRKAGDYNPFAPAPKCAKNELANFINRWSHSPRYVKPVLYVVCLGFRGMCVHNTIKLRIRS